MSQSKQLAFLGIGLFLFLMLMYQGALRIPYFGDDFQWFFAHPGDMIFGNFFHRAPDNDWYRPLQSSVLAAIQFLWADDTLPIRIWHLLLQTSLALLIFHVLRYWKISLVGAILATIYFAAMQAGTFAVICNDTMSQMMGSLFGAFTIWNLYRGMAQVRIGKPFPKWRMIISLAAFFLSLVSKETSAGLCIGVFMLFWIMEPSPPPIFRIAASAIVRSLPFAAIAITYVLMRMAAGSSMPSYGSDNLYQIHFGFNILKNIGLFGFQSVLPFSSAALMHAIYFQQIGVIAAIVFVTGVLATAWIYGIWKSSKRRLAIAVLFFAIPAVIPAIFLNHVSEVYLYNALPYLGVTFGIALEFYLKQASQGLRIALGILLATAFLANIYGAMQKTASLAEESNRSQILMEQIYPVIELLPMNGRLYLVNPVTHEFEYSVFAMKGFGPVKYADPWILRHISRPDVKLFVVDSLEYFDSLRVHPGVAYTMNMTTLRMKPF